ncbi:MAG TPA: zf-HC2 domain-containing protein [Polyangiaceae bacterium]|nr:zf-HC2 domain-containing protein [Polyangiaceae bacterium]
MAFHALSCRQVQRTVDAFADGELSDESSLATERHLARCPACRRHAHWQRAVHHGTRRAVHARGAVTRGFEHRVRWALEHERLEETRERKRHSSGGARFRWGLLVVVPLLALVLLAMNEPLVAGTPAPRVTAASPLDRADELVDQMIGHHVATTPTTPTTTDSDPFLQLEREVGLPVRAPPELARQGASWLAATRVTLGDQRAAALAYRVAGRRCTLFLYDSARLPVRRSRYLSPQAVNQRPVFVGVRRGHAVAAVERRGLGYAIATDLPVQETARLAASIR